LRAEEPIVKLAPSRLVIKLEHSKFFRSGPLLTQNSSQPPVAFFNSTYQDALILTREARDYLTHKEPQERRGLPPEVRLAASCEALRVTARLTQVMAWLLVQRAVHAGEIQREEAASDPYRLSGQEVCEPTDDAAVAEDLPSGLRDLLDRSLSLYQRVARLDALYDQNAPAQSGGQ